MRICILLISVFFCVSAKCEIYKVVDKETGKVTYTNSAPIHGLSSEVEELTDRPINSLGGSTDSSSESTVSGPSASRSISAEQAFESHLSSVQISGSGTVKKVLPQDNNGSRHQKFILQLSSGHTLLVAHNIDLASEIGGLSVGDRVEFFGEYEWNEKGGVIHWTHHDPDGSHISGWLRHGGKKYQ